MKYDDFIAHLDEQGCSIIPEGSSPEGDYYRNCVNSEVSFVGRVERFSVPTMMHITMELAIAPPFEYEDEYEVYKIFRVKAERDKVFKEQK